MDKKKILETMRDMKRFQRDVHRAKEDLEPRVRQALNGYLDIDDAVVADVENIRKLKDLAQRALDLFEFGFELVDGRQAPTENGFDPVECCPITEDVAADFFRQAEDLLRPGQAP